LQSDSGIEVGLYVHVAFCRTKCHYCDFNTYAGLGHLVDDYVDSLVREITTLPPGLPAPTPPATFTIGSIFLGGGTPSLLSVEQVERIVEASHNWQVDPTAEVTLEVNPDDPTVEYLRGLRRIGVNRLSFGVQSFNDDMLNRLGRRHDAQTARDAYDRARQAGFDNVSLDLMFALPGQSLSDWLATLDEAIALAPDHLSAYNLTIEEGTPFGAWAAAGRLTVPNDDQAADMYEAAIDRLGQSGYRQYEISNWARTDPDRDLRAHHNLRYWRNQPYFGVGAGAHSSFARYRYANQRSPATYISCTRKGHPTLIDAEYVGTDLEMSETMILGLRLTEGIDRLAFCHRFGRLPEEVYGPLIAEFREGGLLTEDGGRLALTYRGRMVGNEVFYRFLPEAGQRSG
jgi:oxygen-independent coproporphyrinogen-3 oxidase